MGPVMAKTIEIEDRLATRIEHERREDGGDMVSGCKPISRPIGGLRLLRPSPSVYW